MHRDQLLMSTSLVVLWIGCTGQDALQATVPEGAQPVSMELLVAERDSGFEQYARRAIRDDAAWASAWQQMMGGNDPFPALPDVDFASDVVLLAAMGTQRSSGFSIEIEQVHSKDGNAWVSVVERFPGARCGTLDVLTRPVTAVAVPRYTGESIFLVRPEVVDCE